MISFILLLMINSIIRQRFLSQHSCDNLHTLSSGNLDSVDDLEIR